MRFTIFDVGHGFCAYAVSRNGNCILFDCGKKTDPPISPSQQIKNGGCTGIEYLFITNFDEDHINDLPDLCSRLKLISLVRNKSISCEQLRRVKLEAGPISPAMEKLLELHATFTFPMANPPETPGISWKIFYNKYPADFTDTNNLSLVVFLSVGSTKFIIPGDLEKPGWQKLLSLDEFRKELASIDIFIASHHGREGGYCEDVFKFCRPDAVVFSDGPIEFGTQDMTNTYAQYCTGLTFNNETRKVLSTRKDGSLTWTID